MVESPHGAVRLSLTLAFVALLMAGCTRDEELQRQIVELRAALQAKTKALEETQANVSPQPPSQPTLPPAAPPANGDTITTAELAKAKQRLTELDGEIARLNAKLAEKKEEPPPPISMKFDADGLKDKLENDLTKKAAELRDLVLRQNGVSAINEISIQRLQLPPEVITPFHSAITFTITDNGKPLRVQFPVTADFGGSWRLPSPDKIQQACQLAREQLASGRGREPEPERSTPPPQSTRLAQTKAPRPVASTASDSARSSPGMKRVDANTFVMDWGDNKASPSATGQPSSVIRTPSPTPSSPAPRSSSTPSPSVPAPVMPVQRDIIIKF